MIKMEPNFKSFLNELKKLFKFFKLIRKKIFFECSEILISLYFIFSLEMLKFSILKKKRWKKII